MVPTPVSTCSLLLMDLLLQDVIDPKVMQQGFPMTVNQTGNRTQYLKCATIQRLNSCTINAALPVY